MMCKVSEMTALKQNWHALKTHPSWPVWFVWTKLTTAASARWQGLSGEPPVPITLSDWQFLNHIQCETKLRWLLASVKSLKVAAHAYMYFRNYVSLPSDAFRWTRRQLRTDAPQETNATAARYPRSRRHQVALSLLDGIVTASLRAWWPVGPFT